ncbi:hypothetical protein B4N89_10690 [Embleya scabrispora]|uniref:Uncharacterized protein n=1 Tax=Embleya scabrispora TaxID=159449 RepID=A0A1T3P7A7_9ACTN|nr:hypothetical protein B4N89_10690 [Embleya scabrispora]
MVAHSSEDLRVGEEFFQRYRHARCRDGGSGRDGTLMDVIGTTVYLRGRDGLEFVCRVHDLVIVAAPPPGLHRRVRYIGAGEAGPRPDGVLTELWAVDQGKLAIVQPPARHAWFALLSELESVGLTLGPVADWAEPPFVSDSAGRRPPRR